MQGVAPGVPGQVPGLEAVPETRPNMGVARGAPPEIGMTMAPVQGMM